VRDNVTRCALCLLRPRVHAAVFASAGFLMQGLSWLVNLFENGTSGILAGVVSLFGCSSTVQLRMAHFCFGAFSFSSPCTSSQTKWASARLFKSLHSFVIVRMLACCACACCAVALVDSPLRCSVLDAGSGPALIVTPLAVLNNWVREFRRFAPTLSPVVIYGTQEEREVQRAGLLARVARGGKMPVVLTTYQIAVNDRKYLAPLKWSFLCVDEGHRMKNVHSCLKASLTTYTAHENAAAGIAVTRLLLTGTPLQVGPIAQSTQGGCGPSLLRIACAE
jgi:SNF2 family DNA or RNA helicase